MNAQAITNELFLEYYNNAKNNNPVSLTLPFTGVILSGEGYKENFVDLILPREGCTRMYVVPAFFKQLAKILNVNLAISKRMDEEDFGAILQAIKTLQSTHKSLNEVTVIFNPIEQKLTHISVGSYNRISNVQLFDFANALVESRPELKIIEVIGGEHTTDAEIRILSSEQVALSDILSTDPEQFQFGITLANRGVNTIVGDFAYRLVCSNGMMGIRTDDRFKLGGTDQDSLFKLFQHFEKMQKCNYIPEDFNTNVATASNVPASLNELNVAYRAIVGSIVAEFPEQRIAIEEAVKSRYFPEMLVIEQKLKARNIEVGTLTTKQMQLVKSEKDMWSLINILTDLGSNKSVYPLANTASLQRLGGKMLTRDFDLTDIHLLML